MPRAISAALKSDIPMLFGAAGFLIAGAACAETAWLRARELASLGVICGHPAGQPHCAWCVAAAGFAILGALALIQARRLANAS